MNNFSFYFLVISYIIFGCVSAYFEIKSLISRKKIEIIDFFRFFYLFFYCIVPICSLLVLHNGSYSNIKAFRYLESDNIIFNYVILFVQIAFYIAINYFFKKFSEKYKTKYKSNYIIDNKSSEFYIGNFIILLIGWISLILYTWAYGSIFGIFEYAPLIRDNIFLVENKLTFFQPFTMILNISTLNYIILLKNMKGKSTKYKIITSLLSLVSFFGSVVVLISIDSRTQILMMILIIMFYLFYKKIFNLNLKTLIIGISCIFVFLIIMLNVDNITSFIRGDDRNNTSANLVDFVSKNFSFIYVNDLNIQDRLINQKNLDIRIDDNIKGVFISYLPRRFKKNMYIDMHRYNTSFTPQSVGQLPSDLITSSIYSLGYLGIFVFALWIPLLLYFLTRIFSKYNELNDFYIMLLGYFGFNVCMSLISYYDISCIMFSCFDLVASYIILTFTKLSKDNVLLKRIYNWLN